MPIVPKSTSKKFRLHLLGEYTLSLGEVFYLGFSIMLILVVLIFMKNPIWLKWTIFGIDSISFLGFISVGHNKLYQFFWKFIIHMGQKKTYKLEIPKLEELKDLIYNPETKHYFSVMELKTTSLEVAEFFEINNAFEEIEDILRTLGIIKFYLINHSEMLNIRANQIYLDEVKTKTDSKIKKLMIESFEGASQEASQLMTGKYYLVIKSTSLNLIKNARQDLLNFNGKYAKLISLSKQKQKQVLLKQSDLFMEKNQITMKYNKVKVNDVYCKYLVMTSSRPMVQWFWLNSLTFDPNVEFTISGQKMNSEQTIKQLNKQLNKNIQRLKETSDHIKISIIEENISSLQLTIDNLRTGEQTIFKSLILLKVWGETAHEVDLRAKKLKISLNSTGARFAVPYLENKDVWSLKAPLAINISEKFGMLKDMLSFTLGASWGYSSVLMNDKNGMVLGWSNAGPIYWNPMMSNEDLQNDSLSRKNLNIAILGGSGSGKSTLTQKIVNWNVATGGSVWVVDPKDEDYYGLANEYEGKIFEFGLNDGTNKLNPFEIMGWNDMTPTQRKHEIVSIGEFLDGWLDILFNDKDFKNKILMVVKEKYLNKHKIKNMTWLTFSLLEKEFIKKGGDFKKSIDKFSIYSAPGHFLNGKSNVSNLLNEDFVVFQASKIFNSPSESFKNASLILLIQLIQSKAKLNKNSGNIFHAVIDEAHNFFNTEVGKHKIQSFIREARGWNSGVILISQNPQDFMGGKIMNNITTTFYGSLDSETVNELSKTLSLSADIEGLNKTEKKFILSASRGQFLLVVNSSNKATVQIKITAMEFNAINGNLMKFADQKN